MHQLNTEHQRDDSIHTHTINTQTHILTPKKGSRLSSLNLFVRAGHHGKSADVRAPSAALAFRHKHTNTLGTEKKRQLGRSEFRPALARTLAAGSFDALRWVARLVAEHSIHTYIYRYMYKGALLQYNAREQMRVPSCCRIVRRLCRVVAVPSFPSSSSSSTSKISARRLPENARHDTALNG